jgi:hypothetical protein
MKVECYRSIFCASRSSSAFAAINSGSLYPSHPFSPDVLLRKISASFEVANAFKFLTDSIVGGARSPVTGSEDACCDFLDVERVSIKREVV